MSSNKTLSRKAVSNQAMSSTKAMSGVDVSNQTVSSNKTMSSKTVSNQAVSSVNQRSSMGNSVVGDGVGNSVGLGVGSSSRVGNLSDVALNVVGVVLDSLDTAVGEVHRVGSLNNTGAVVGLALAEGSARVIISHSVVVGVGGDLSEVGLGVAYRVSNNTVSDQTTSTHQTMS